MTTPSHKLLLFLKRRPGMSLQEFRDYYENVHRKLAEKYASGIRRYVRRYVQPLSNPRTGRIEEMEFDVITELWFDDRAVFDKVAELTSGGVLPPEIEEDEKRLFDRTKSRSATVVECDSELAAP
ncbi:MAG TPA: EthD domain-containing protein [Steroidobacteraceae bacterium]|nr:EthD domain-containing protein [Steroidobacteraceae bacterium]